MKLIIILRKDVENEAEGTTLFELVKQKLADRPDITVTAQVTTTLEQDSGDGE